MDVSNANLVVQVRLDAPSVWICARNGSSDVIVVTHSLSHPRREMVVDGDTNLLALDGVVEPDGGKRMGAVVGRRWAVVPLATIASVQRVHTLQQHLYKNQLSIGNVILEVGDASGKRPNGICSAIAALFSI